MGPSEEKGGVDAGGGVGDGDRGGVGDGISVNPPPEGKGGVGAGGGVGDGFSGGVGDGTGANTMAGANPMATLDLTKISFAAGARTWSRPKNQ
jgi:hypothetical protein